MDDIGLLLDRINELLDAPAQGVRAPALARIEHTLTDGYARALALEGERWRIERRIGEVARLQNGDQGHTGELSALAQRLSAADRELARLRGLLTTLRARL